MKISFKKLFIFFSVAIVLVSAFSANLVSAQTAPKTGGGIAETAFGFTPAGLELKALKWVGKQAGVDLSPANMVGYITTLIGYVISFIAGIAVTILAWAIGVVLKISLDAVNTSAVQGGFNVTLAIANLGFVIGIIIFAIATILRAQTFGLKNFLYKIVMMAVLVNFGLIIAGTMINMSNSLTQYFLDAVTGGKGAESVNKFASTMATRFEPQSLFLPFKELDIQDPAVAKNLSAPDDVSKFLQPIAGLFFLIIALVLIIITLTVFVAMLIIRYVWLVILLITLPLAWMSWSFPYLSKHFGSWWNKFIQQILFPPVAIFFLWVALAVSSATFSANSPTASSIPLGDVAGRLIAPIAIQLLNIVVLSGLMIGGLMAAQSLGGAFADTGMKWANGIKGFALGKAGRLGGRAVSAIPRKAGVQDWAKTKMETGGYFGRLAGRGVKMLGRVGGENQVAYWEKQHGGKSKDQLFEELRASPTGVSPQERAAILKIATAKGWAKDLTGTDRDKLVTEDAFKAIGGGPIWDDMNKSAAFAFDKDLMEKLNKSLDGTKESAKALADTMKALGDKVKRNDVSKMDFQTLFSKSNAFGKDPNTVLQLRKAWLDYIEKNNISLTGSVLSGLNGPGLTEFQSSLSKQLTNSLNEAKNSFGETSDEYKKAKKNLDTLENAAGFNATSAGAPPPGAPPASPPPSAPSKP